MRNSPRFLMLTILIGNLWVTSFAVADANCQCISTTTFPAPNKKLQYVAQCYANGQEIKILESRTVSGPQEADKITQNIMKTYNVKKGDCIKLPNGSMVLVTPTSFSHQGSAYEN